MFNNRSNRNADSSNESKAMPTISYLLAFILIVAIPMMI